ncbi:MULTISPECIES: winged helix-turn-helix domain-containing protein [unclassified Micromonospora]|uniref:winged helix-turn-helix domain-containing protein n=1 Tax=unclassified Micromonospora TaxID=2617518 RepID=UPI000EF4B48C|nr:MULTISPECIES: winged helix-turn-helix domain-containing protein [unclassified Micromonospora]RLP91815.1 winged helix family transcriptional regulator [Micromonospora sp. BL4]RLP96790.1 winged helix family transcriptional regulator [Micromonospora sp. CV4]
MSGEEVPIVVCVSADVAMRQRVVRQLDGVGPVVSCADLDELRAMLFPSPPEDTALAVAPVDPPPARHGLISWGELVVDRAGHLVTWRGDPLPLTRTERELLARLIGPPLVVWSYEQLFAAVWNGAYLGDTAILHSAVKRLRHKLRSLPGGPRVHTVRGVGYRIDPPPRTA